MADQVTATVDVRELETKVMSMYREVAEHPEGKYHFEMGRPLAERLGYPGEWLDQVPDGAVDSFAGVGYFFDLAELEEGETVADFGSGSGMDVFAAALQVGASGTVIGIDFTAEQLAKSRRLAADGGFEQVELREGRIESPPLEPESVDCVISNGVINLAPDKRRVFAAAASALRPGGRLAIADIISERELKESTRCNADLWAACIAGAAQQDDYRQAIESAGLEIETIRENPYEFISDQALEASAKYGVKSISLLARR
ncbi:MAG TPA: methyltransferase domain-containing protein [Thermoleophilaceae bacterium]|nr:methyltransferase domain-containing protein [Thermoleophilaceae bacterium]